MNFARENSHQLFITLVHNKESWKGIQINRHPKDCFGEKAFRNSGFYERTWDVNVDPYRLFFFLGNFIDLNYDRSEQSRVAHDVEIIFFYT